MSSKGIQFILLMFLFVNIVRFSLANDDDVNDSDDGNDVDNSNERLTSCVCGDWESWTGYTACTEHCGGGQQGRSRARVCKTDTIVIAHGVINCVKKYSQFRECNVQPCGCESICSQWSPWTNGSCSRRCGEGVLTSVRRRFCLGSQGCPEIETGSLPCNSNPCSECSCESWQSWSSYSLCSKSCGQGVQTRQRSRICQPTSVDQDCSNATAEWSTAPCNYGVCCSEVCTPWSTWWKDRCSVTCDEGSLTTIRSRLCALETCSDTESTVESCKYETCLSTCESTCSPWNNKTATPCSTSCGGGVRYIKSHRDCRHPDCQADKVIIAKCNQERCRTCNDSCRSWSSWSDSACSASCDEGTSTSTRTRSCDINGCDVRDTKQNICKLKTCDATCDRECDAWTPWVNSTCSVTCDRGFVSSIRNRTCKQDDCISIEAKTTPCREKTCNDTCERTCSGWSDWTEDGCLCDEAETLRSRTRTCRESDCTTIESANTSCSSKECPLQCDDLCTAWSSWITLGKCSVNCGGGYQDEERVRKCQTKNDNPVCNILETRKQKCNEQLCTGVKENSVMTCPFLNGYLSDPTDCTKFYQCVWGKPVQLICPRGTGWDSSKSTCNFKYKLINCR